MIRRTATLLLAGFPLVAASCAPGTVFGTSPFDDPGPAYAEVQNNLERQLTALRASYEVPEDTRPVDECTMDATGWQGYAEDGTDRGDASQP